MENEKNIIQPNHVTTARFTLTVLEKNIVYTIIDELQKVMSKDLNQVFKEQKITVELKKIEKNNNYRRVVNAVKSLGNKHVEFEAVIPKTGKIKYNSSNLVSGISYEKNSQYISFWIPSLACRFFCYIGGGFTSFQKTIAISLGSLYSKSFYELCCRWKDKGGFQCSIETLKTDYLSIPPNKYKQIAHLRKVLDSSKKELELRADLYFSYRLKKTGRSYTDISIKIHQNSPNEEEYYGVREEHYNYAYMFLNRLFPNYESDKASRYLHALADSGNLDKAFSRFIRLDDELSTGSKTKTDIRNLLTTIILPELGVKIKSKNEKTAQLKLRVF